MKCVYKFPVTWIVEVDGVRPFTHNGWHFDFLLQNGRISHILATVPLAASDKLPELQRNAQNAAAFDLSINEPASAQLLMKTLRTLEGFLSVYGLESIGLDQMDISWVPESEEDKKRLQTTGFSFKFKKPEATPVRAPFSVVTRAVIASTEHLEWEIPLNFFRRGRIDFLERRYIDAIYDFYLLLETLFANGKTKNRVVKQQFANSSELVAFSSRVLSEGEQSVIRRGGRASLLVAFRATHSKQTPQQFLEHLVDLRGFLHHHSLKNPKIWHPALEYDYELDAILIQDLCFKICSTMVESVVCKPLTPPLSVQ
jgi:hypothetical protein